MLKEKLREYIYVDRHGIDSLMAQINNDVIVEKVKYESSENAKKGGGKVTAKIGFSKLLSSLFQSDVDANVDAELSTVRKMAIEEKIVESYGHKIRVLTDYVKAHEGYHVSILDALRESESSTSLIFLECNGVFRLRMEFLPQRNLQYLENTDYLCFEMKIDVSGRKQTHKEHVFDYDENDNYFLENNPCCYKTIVMNMNIGKMCVSLGNTSHLGMIFREPCDGNITLNVFGHVKNIDRGLFQVKPFAVWR